MSKGNVFINDFLKLWFNGTNIANIADNAATSPLGSLYVSLHTASPGAAGDQTTNEISYTGYARVAVVRTNSGWTASTTQATGPIATIAFGAMTAGTGGTATHFAVGTLTSGTGKLLCFGTITPNIPVSNGTTPQLTTATSITET
jgi:hypothetical protein